MTIKKLNWIVAGTAIGLTALFCGIFVFPGSKSLSQRRLEVKEKLAEVNAEQQRIGNISEVYATLVRLDEMNQDFRKKLPAERQFGEYLKSLSDTLRRQGIEQCKVQQRPELQLDEAKLPRNLGLIRGTGILPVEIVFDSTFAQLFEFLKGVEDLPRLSHVESLRVVNDEQNPGQVHAEVVLHTYYKPETDNAGSKL